MAIDNFKNGSNLKKQIGKIIFLLSILLFPINLSAQITIIEQADWYYLKDKILAPYDSSYMYIQVYPILEAYKKYIGQRIFFMNDKAERANPLNRPELINERIRNKGWLGPSREFGYRRNLNNKYFDIVDVMCVEDSPLNKPYKITKSTWFSSYLYEFLLENETNPRKKVGVDVKSDNQPCFVLKDIQSGETLYLHIRNMTSNGRTSNITDIILVGGYEKLKEMMVGQNFVYYELDREYNALLGDYKRKIESNWHCTDVSIYGGKLVYIFRNKLDTTKTKMFSIEEFKTETVTGIANSSGEWATEESFQVYENNCREKIEEKREQKLEEERQREEREKLEREREQAKLESEQKEKQEIYERRKALEQQTQKEEQERQKKLEQQIQKEEQEKRQQLTSKYGKVTADKIIAGKFEIGMTKSICKEIIDYVSIYCSIIEIDKATNTEKWQVGSFRPESATYLYFIGDKLVRSASH
jgi:hypothetical protein